MDRRIALGIIAGLNLIALFLIVKFVPSHQVLMWYLPKDMLSVGAACFIANKKIEGSEPLPLMWRISINATLLLMLLR